MPNGINLGIMPPYSFMVVKFDVYVLSYDINPIINEVSIVYPTLDDNGNIKINEIKSNLIYTFIK